MEHWDHKDMQSASNEMIPAQENRQCFVVYYITFFLNILKNGKTKRKKNVSAHGLV